jgi:hypothetical protein
MLFMDAVMGLHFRVTYKPEILGAAELLSASQEIFSSIEYLFSQFGC